MSNNDENKPEKKIKELKLVDDDDLDIDDDEYNKEPKNNNEIKEAKIIKADDDNLGKNEDNSPYYSDETRKSYKISSSPFISEISIINIKKNIPPTRCYLTAEYSKNNNSIICIGGSDDKCNQYNKITEYDLSKNVWNLWKNDCQSETGLELSGHSSNLIFLNNQEKIFIFGGYDNWKKEFTAQSYLVDINMRIFEKVNYYKSFDNNNELPLPRTYHSANYDKEKNVIYIYGGTDMNINHCKEENAQSLWKFDLIKKIWYKKNLEIKSPLILHDGPPRGHTSILLNDKLYIFGGVTSFKKFNNSLHVLNLEEKYIELIDYVFHVDEMKFDKILIELIPNLFGHKIVMNSNKNKLYIVGGMDNFKYVGDESLIYKIERDQDFIFNKGKVEFFPMKNILEISINKEDSISEQHGERPEPENKIDKKDNKNPNKRIKWKKLFYVNIN